MGFKAVCADVRWRFKKFQLHFNRLWRVPKGFQGFIEFKDYRGVSVSFMGISGEVLKVFQSASWTFQRIIGFISGALKEFSETFQGNSRGCWEFSEAP